MLACRLGSTCFGEEFPGCPRALSIRSRFSDADPRRSRLPPHPPNYSAARRPARFGQLSLCKAAQLPPRRDSLLPGSLSAANRDWRDCPWEALLLHM